MAIEPANLISIDPELSLALTSAFDPLRTLGVRYGYPGTTAGPNDEDCGSPNLRIGWKGADPFSNGGRMTLQRGPGTIVGCVGGSSM
jgi:hypothetical protein